MANDIGRSVTVNDGAELAVVDVGEAGAPAVLLLHGFSLDHTTWDRVVHGLLDDGYRVVTPDLRGHGGSTLGDSATLDRFVSDVATTMTALDLDHAHLVGHSFGAVIALAARVDRRTSDRLATVTAIAGTEQAIQNPIMKLGAAIFSSSWGVRMLGRRVPGRAMISSWFGKKPAADDLDWIRDISGRCSQATRKAITDGTADLDLRPTFAEPGPPTMIMCGRRDKATPFKVSERIASAIDGSSLVGIDDAGHMVMVERPGEVLAHLTDWFERHPSGED